jgi:acyl-CoA thioester hydrolase
MSVNNPKLFVKPLIVSTADIDNLGHVNNVVYIRWIQEVAEAHWLTVALPEIRQRYLWVVLRHEVDYRTPAFLNDSVAGTTWVGDHRGARFERYVKIFEQGSDKIFVEAKTIWCLLESKTLRPLRIPEEVLSLL